MRNYYEDQKRPQRRNVKIGFWGYLAIAASAGAAVKITKAILKSREKEAKYRSKDKDIDDEDIDQEDDLSFEVYRGTFKQVIKARKSVIELMDLYGCCTFAEILDIMNQDYDDNAINKVFDKSCKFRIRFDDGKYVLMAQPPQEVAPEKIEKESKDEKD